MKKHISITLHAILIFEKDENIHAHDTVLLNAAPRKGTQLCSYRPKQKQNQIVNACFNAIKIRNCQNNQVKAKSYLTYL